MKPCWTALAAGLLALTAAPADAAAPQRRPSGGSRPSYSRPSYSRPAPSYSRPSYSRPSYSRPAPSASRPSYSRPSSGFRPSYSRPSVSRSSRSVPSAARSGGRPSVQRSTSRPSAARRPAANTLRRSTPSQASANTVRRSTASQPLGRVSRSSASARRTYPGSTSPAARATRSTASTSRGVRSAAFRPSGTGARRTASVFRPSGAAAGTRGVTMKRSAVSSAPRGVTQTASRAAQPITMPKLPWVDPGPLNGKAATPAGPAVGDGSKGYDVVFTYKWGGDPGHHTFATLAEAKAFAAEYSKGVYSTADGTLTSLKIVPLGNAGAKAAGSTPQLTSITYDQNASGRPVARKPAPPTGWLSEKYEVGRKGGPGTVSTGKGDKGGVSYGLYQLSSKTGTAQQFVDRFYAKEFQGLTPGTAAFNTKWRQLAQDQPTAFADRQREFIRETHYDPVVRKINKDVGLNFADRPSAVQNFLWSVAVQFGETGGSRLVDKALKQAAGKQSVSSLSDEQILTAINAERGREDAKGNLVRFKSSSKAVQDGVRKRYQNELRDALNALDQERQAAANLNTPIP